MSKKIANKNNVCNAAELIRILEYITRPLNCMSPDPVCELLHIRTMARNALQSTRCICKKCKVVKEEANGVSK